jgi:hypothetical protein
MTQWKIEVVQNHGFTLRRRIFELLCRHEYSSETKTVLLTAYMDIALEHHKSISLLVKSQLYGSAFALVRSLFDALFRALWINACATQDQIEQVANRDDYKFPKLDDLVACIDKNYSTDNFFTSIKDASWSAMCSYTHSGLLQITRRFTGDYVKSNYGATELAEVLNATNAAIILLSRMFFMSAGHKEEASEVEKMIVQCHHSPA